MSIPFALLTSFRSNAEAMIQTSTPYGNEHRSESDQDNGVRSLLP